MRSQFRSWRRLLPCAEANIHVLLRRLVMAWAGKAAGCSSPPSPPEEGYAATETNGFQLSQPGTFPDTADRNGARALLAQAVETEVAALLSAHACKLTDDGKTAPRV